MIELRPERFPCVTHLLSGLRYYSPIAWSVVEGKQAGSILVDRSDDPSYALIRGVNRYFYLVGRDGPFPEETLASLDVRRPGFTICVEPIKWVQDLQNAIGYKANSVSVLNHKFPDEWQKADQSDLSAPPHCRIERIDTELFDRIGKEFTQVMAVLWARKEEFLANGLGYCLLEDDTITSICFTGFVGGNGCDITVITDPDFRRRGYAKLVSAALVEEAFEVDLNPQWHTTADNTASLAIATALGFQCTGEYSIVEVSRG